MISIVTLAAGYFMGFVSYPLIRHYHRETMRVRFLTHPAPYEYMIQRVDARGYPLTRPEFQFYCQNVGDDPDFEPGETDDMAVEYRGKCVDIAPPNGWITDRDENGRILHTGVEQ